MPSSRGRRQAQVCSGLDIEELDVAGVSLYERAPRLYLIAHQHREQLIGGRRVVDRHELEGARLRVHGRLGELVGVHLTEAFEPLELDTPLREREHLCAQLLERERLLGVAVELELEGRRSRQLEQL